MPTKKWKKIPVGCLAILVSALLDLKTCMLQPAVDLKEDSDEEKVRETTVKHKIKVSVWIQQGQTWFIFLVCIALFPSVCLTTLPVLFLSLLICHCGTTGSLPLSSKFKSINGKARTLSSGISWDVYLERILNKDKNNMIKGKKKISTFLIVGRTHCIYQSERYRFSSPRLNESSNSPSLNTPSDDSWVVTGQYFCSHLITLWAC